MNPLLRRFLWSRGREVGVPRHLVMFAKYALLGACLFLVGAALVARFG